jgi:hypothetical protein
VAHADRRAAGCPAGAAPRACLCRLGDNAALPAGQPTSHATEAACVCTLKFQANTHEIACICTQLHAYICPLAFTEVCDLADTGRMIVAWPASSMPLHPCRWDQCKASLLTPAHVVWQGVALAGVALLALALAKWTWRTWVPSSGANSS